MQRPFYKTLTVFAGFSPRFARDLCQNCGFPFTEVLPARCTLLYSTAAQELGQCIGFFCHMGDCQKVANRIAEQSYMYPYPPQADQKPDKIRAFFAPAPPAEPEPEPEPELDQLAPTLESLTAEQMEDLINFIERQLAS